MTQIILTTTCMVAKYVDAEGKITKRNAKKMMRELYQCGYRDGIKEGKYNDKEQRH